MADTIYKFRATYNDGTTYSAECDSSSAITQGEINLTDLVSVEIGNCAISIGNSTFSNCSSLTSCAIGNGVTSIGNYAFYNCTSLTSVDIPDSVTSISDYAFYNCTSLTSVDIPDSVTSIGIYAFNGCRSLTSCTIGNGVTSISDYAFYRCTSLTSIDIPNSVTSIGERAFQQCSGLTSIGIPDSVTIIGLRAFYGCRGLTSVIIGSGVTSISGQAFYSCSGLTSIDIPDSVTSIGDNAFNGCRSLTSITINATTPPALSNANAFRITNDCPIYVPSHSLETYKAATNWSTYASRIQPIPNEGGCMIKYNNSTISNWYFANDNIIKVYRNNAVCYYKITSGDTPSRLPSGYTEVEYIENTSTAYIDTSFKPNQDTRITCTMQTVTSTSYGRLLGCGGYDKTNAIQFDYENGATGTLHISWGHIAGWTTYSSCVGDYNKHTYDWDKNEFYRDKGETNQFSASTTYTNFQCQQNLSIFMAMQASGPDRGGAVWKGKMFDFKVYDDGTLIRDLVPCTRDNDSMVGCYDIVNDVFYYPPNYASYPLVAGPTV